MIDKTLNFLQSNLQLNVQNSSFKKNILQAITNWMIRIILYSKSKTVLYRVSLLVIK